MSAKRIWIILTVLLPELLGFSIGKLELLFGAIPNTMLSYHCINLYKAVLLTDYHVGLPSSDNNLYLFLLSKRKPPFFN